MAGLNTINDDALLGIFAVLPVSDILVLRQTSKRLSAFSRLHIVWHNACTEWVLNKGYPFPELSLASTSAAELERCTRRACRLAAAWRAGALVPRAHDFAANTSGTAISDVRFVPGTDARRVLTLSRGIWSVITVWDTGGRGPARRVAEYSPRGALFTGLALNTDPAADAALAVGMVNDGCTSIAVLALTPAGFAPLRTLASPARPMALHGTLLAASDDFAGTALWDVRTGAAARLAEPAPAAPQYNRALHVVFARGSVLVVRARAIALFPLPALHAGGAPPPTLPAATHSFGWVDGVAVAPPPAHAGAAAPLALLVRTESDNPWAPAAHTLDLYALDPAPGPALGAAAAPHALGPRPAAAAEPEYAFPPRRTAHAASARGALRCTAVALAPRGSALWVRPPGGAGAGLVAEGGGPPAGAGAREELVAAAFPGPLSAREAGAEGDGVGEVPVRTLWSGAVGGWTALDYDEAAGRVALGTGRGVVTILTL